jgi:hypothetical protein
MKIPNSFGLDSKSHKGMWIMQNFKTQRTRLRISLLIMSLFLMPAFAFLSPASVSLSRAQAQSTAIDPVEMEFWKSISTSKNPAELQAYLDIFPKGRFAILARIRLKALKNKPQTKPVAAQSLKAKPKTKAEDKTGSVSPIIAEIIRLETNPETLKSYITIDPEGNTARLARKRLNELKAGAQSPATKAETKTTPPPVLSIAAKTPPPIHDCDRLAADPDDSAKVTDGVKFEDFLAGQAVEACRAALKIYPNTARFQYQLGRGLHKQKRYSETLTAYRKAAAANYTIALTSIGMIYFDGDGVIIDFAESAKWLRKAAEKGDAQGILFLALMLDNGLGVSKDSHRAVQYFIDLLSKKARFAFSTIEKLKKNPDSFSKEFYRELQQLLKESGEYNAPIDGKFTWTTLRAIEAYVKQRSGEWPLKNDSGRPTAKIPLSSAPPPIDTAFGDF